MKSTILHDVSPDDLRAIIREEIREHLKPQLEKKYVPKNSAAKRLQKTVQTLDAWHRAGILKKKYIGGRVYYYEDDISRLESTK